MRGWCDCVDAFLAELSTITTITGCLYNASVEAIDIPSEHGWSME